MTVYNGLIGLFWIIFLVVWGISALSSKRTIGGTGWFGWRAVFALLLFWFFQAGIYRVLAPYDAMVEGNATIHLIGVICTGLGIAFAIWARFYLGKNWGMPMSVKENPELVTKGPYRFVRHPIYTGVMLAMFGSVLASSLVWLLVLGFFGSYFVYSAKKEEKMMEKEFPDKYPAYKKRSKMLVPWIL